MTLKKYLSVFALSALVPAWAFGQFTFSDDFNRPDSTNLGPDWTEQDIDSAISGGALDVIAATSPGFSALNTIDGFFTATAPQSGGPDFFELTGDVALDAAAVGANSAWAGLLFNYQDNDNYYAFRFNGQGNVQWLRVQNGSQSAIFNEGAGTFTVVGDEFYTMNVVSATGNGFVKAFQIEDSSGTVVFSRGNTFDNATAFSNGLGGFYSATTNSLQDNIILETTQVPEPATTAAIFGGAVLLLAVGRRYLRSRK